MFLANYLDLLDHDLAQLGKVLGEIGAAHAKEPEILQGCTLFARMMDTHRDKLRPHGERYHPLAGDAPDEFKLKLFHGPRKGSVGLLRDLQDLYVQTMQTDSTIRTLDIASRALRDQPLQEAVKGTQTDLSRLAVWLHSHFKAQSAQTLIAASS